MNDKLLNYFKVNLEIYSLEALCNESLKVGNSQEDIDEVCTYLKSNNSPKNILLFYSLPILSFIFIVILFIFLNLNYTFLKLFLFLLPFITFIFPLIILTKRNIDKLSFKIYTFSSIILIPVLLSLLVASVNFYGQFIAISSDGLRSIAPEIIIYMDTFSTYVLVYYSILVGLFTYNFIYHNYMSKVNKIYPILIGLVIISFSFSFSILLYKIFSNILLSFFGNIIG